MAADNLIPMVSTPVQQCHLPVASKMEILLSQQKNERVPDIKRLAGVCWLLHVTGTLAHLKAFAMASKGMYSFI